MQQNTSYPDPAQLQRYAEDPMPFHDIVASDLELADDERLRYGAEHVAYQYHPTYIMVETERDEYTEASDLPWFDLSHAKAWNRAMNVEIQEDFIVASDLVTGPDGESHKYDAYWILETVTFKNPNLYADDADSEVSAE